MIYYEAEGCNGHVRLVTEEPDVVKAAQDVTEPTEL